MQYQLTAGDLEVLLALSRGGNLAEAGKRLAANASTVFRTVQRIEKQLGQTLFTRSRSGYLANDIALNIVGQVTGPRAREQRLTQLLFDPLHCAKHSGGVRG